MAQARPSRFLVGACPPDNGGPRSRRGRMRALQSERLDVPRSLRTQEARVGEDRDELEALRGPRLQRDGARVAEGRPGARWTGRPPPPLPTWASATENVCTPTGVPALRPAASTRSIMPARGQVLR